jgi:sulfur carrier protein
MTMRLTVNGAPTEVDQGVTVAALVATLTDQRRRVAVAVNGEVVPRSSWETTPLREGDSVEVLAAVAGG